MQALVYLLYDLLRDFTPPAFQVQPVEEGQALLDRPGRDLGQRMVVDEDVARGGVQPLSAAVGTGLLRNIARELFAHDARVGFPIALLEVRNDADEGMLAGLRAAVGEIPEADLLAAAAVENDATDVLRQFGERCFRIEVVMPRQRLDHLEVVGIATIPAAHRPAGEAQFGVADDAFGIEELLVPKAVAGRTRSVRIVEREHPRFQFRKAVVADRAGEPGGKQDFSERGAVGVVIAALSRHGRDHGDAVAEGQRRLQALGQTLREVVADLETVDDGLDRVLSAQFQRREFAVEIVDFAVDAGAHEALGAEIPQDAGVFPLAIADHRRQQHQPRAFRQVEHGIDHLADRLGIQRFSMVRAARRAHAREHQPKVIVDFGHGADRRARVVTRRLLLDGDRRTQSLDVVEVRLLHHRQELARIGRKGLDVAPLPLGIDRVEGERRLAGSR